MAWHLAPHVIRGEVDNRTRGRITGRVWLAGIAEPLTLELIGDCEPDLAGCEVHFANPTPVPLVTAPPLLKQRGRAGRMTAARKVQVYRNPDSESFEEIPAGQKPPEHLVNCLHLQWFSPLNGETIIESAVYRIKISEPAWRFTEKETREHEEQVQTACREASAAFRQESEDAKEWDEFRSEQFLRENDARVEQYRALLEKFTDHPEADRLIAREMGWKWVEEALDREAALPPDEETAAEFDPQSDLTEPLLDPEREGIDWVRDEEGEILHPLEKQGYDAVCLFLQEMKEPGFSNDPDNPAIGEFLNSFMSLNAKMAGALHDSANGWLDVDAGFTIAQLKRVLALLNQTLTLAEKVAAAEAMDPERLSYYRGVLFALREGVLGIIKDLRR